METTVSYRQVGRDLPGRVYRGRAVEDRSFSPAFGTTTSRFPSPPIALSISNDRTSPIQKVRTQAEANTHRVLGRMDKSKRFKPRQYASITPGPGTYNWKPNNSTKGIKSVFLSKGSRSASSTPNGPSPGQYDPKTIAATRSAVSVFRSNVKRMASIRSPATPAPWHYSPKFTAIQKSSSALTSTFKQASAVRRFQVNVFDPTSKPLEETSPGPGSYEIPRDLLPSTASLPSAAFLSVEIRFPAPRTITPEPGSYDTLPRQSPRLPVSAAVFKSDTTRLATAKQSGAPGPGCYKPNLLPKRRSFLLNLTKRWVR